MKHSATYLSVSIPENLVVTVCEACRRLPPRLAASPEVLVACITDRCNLRCPNCNYWRNSGDAAEELSVEEHLGLAQDLGHRGLRRVVLTGGEPTIRQEWMELVNVWSSSVSEVLLLTNGTSLDDTAVKFLASRRNVRVIISWDGWDMALTDRFTGRPDMRNRVWEGIRRAGSHRGLKGRIGANITITPANMLELTSITASLADAGVSFFHFHIIYSARRDYRFSKRQALQLMPLTSDAVHLLARRKCFNVINHVPFAFVRLSHCFIPLSNSTVGPRGEVYGCIPAKGGFKDIASNALGNIRERPFSAIWKSRPYQNFRKAAREGRHQNCLACLACHAARHFSCEPCRSCVERPVFSLGSPEFY